MATKANPITKSTIEKPAFYNLAVGLLAVCPVRKRTIAWLLVEME